MGSPLTAMLANVGVPTQGATTSQEDLCASVTSPRQREALRCPPVDALAAPPTDGDPYLGAQPGAAPGLELPPSYEEPVPSQIQTQVDLTGAGSLPPDQGQYYGAKQAYDESMAPGGAGGYMASREGPNALQSLLLKLFGGGR